MFMVHADLDVIRDEAVNILLAGRDTVSAIVRLLRSGHTRTDLDRLLH